MDYTVAMGNLDLRCSHGVEVGGFVPATLTEILVGSTKKRGNAVEGSVPSFIIFINSKKRKKDIMSGQGRRTGIGNYMLPETMNLLEVLEDVLPIGSEEWEEALARHSLNYPGRDKPSIARKFATLHRKQIPTGDPNCPPEVRAAKRIKYLIGPKAAIGSGEENFDPEDGFVAVPPPEEEEANVGGEEPAPPPSAMVFLFFDLRKE